MPGEPLRDSECAPAAIDATALYIYTSGTTGLPKAANVSHYRLMQWSHWFAGMMDTKPSDRMFNCLPLYHSVGGVVAMFCDAGERRRRGDSTAVFRVGLLARRVR